MKKIIIAILVLLLLCGCSANLPAVSSIPDNQPSADAQTLDRENLFAALDAIADTRPGTAGSSLRSTYAAVELLNWTEKNTSDKDKVSTALGEYFASMSYDDIALFAESFVSVDSAACDILSNADYTDDMISDSNAVPEYDRYTIEKYELFCSAINEYLTIGHQ